MINEKTFKLFQKGSEANRKAFIHAPNLEKYVEDEEIVVIVENIFKTLSGNDRKKSEGLIDGKNL